MHDYANALRVRDEEHFSVSDLNEEKVEPATHSQDSLVPSACVIE